MTKDRLFIVTVQAVQRDGPVLGSGPWQHATIRLPIRAANHNAARKAALFQAQGQAPSATVEVVSISSLDGDGTPKGWHETDTQSRHTPLRERQPMQAQEQHGISIGAAFALMVLVFLALAALAAV